MKTIHVLFGSNMYPLLLCGFQVVGAAAYQKLENKKMNFFTKNKLKTPHKKNKKRRKLKKKPKK